MRNVRQWTGKRNRECECSGYEKANCSCGVTIYRKDKMRNELVRCAYYGGTEGE